MTLTEILVLLLAAVLALAVARSRRQLAALRVAHARELVEQRATRDAEVRALAERTATLFDCMVEAVIVIDNAGRVQLANRAAHALFNITGSAIGRTVLEATRHHEIGHLVGRLDREPEVLAHDMRLEGLPRARCLQVNAVALRRPDHARDGSLLVFHDLTRLRQLESLRQEFVANVSHELRTPLSLIKSAAETLIDGAKDDPTATARFLDIIDKHASRLTSLIDDLLQLSRFDSGRVELHLEPVPLRLAAQEALDDAALIAHTRAVTLENQVPHDVLALADPDRLRQVLANLVDNAIKYGRAHGHVIISGRKLGDARVELTVCDDGPGIPLEAQSRIFERFYRVDKARSREQGGTGLGLAIVKNVVQAHGGEVRVDSTKDTGTKFFVTLPASTTRGGAKAA